MKRALRIAGALVALVVLGATLALAYVQITWRRDFSSAALPALAASTDPHVIARGAYVTHSVAHCTHCHDAPGLSGGTLIDAGPFGRFAPSNLTPHATGIGTLSDGQVARAIRAAVDHDGTLAPMMLVGVGAMSDEDLVAVLSYLRSLPPVDHAAPADEWGIVAKALASKFAPRTTTIAHVAEVDAVGEPSVARGAYLANGPALCATCHTARDPMQGFAVVGPLLAGDPHPHVDKVDAAFEIVAPNLTNLGFTEDGFVERFRAGPLFAGSIMPWQSFRTLTESDLRSLFRYLRTLPPVDHDVGHTRRPR